MSLGLGNVSFSFQNKIWKSQPFIKPVLISCVTIIHRHTSTLDLSSFCQMYEEVRKSLEACSIEKDIEYFVNQQKTGQTPPGEWSGGAGHLFKQFC